MNSLSRSLTVFGVLLLGAGGGWLLASKTVGSPEPTTTPTATTHGEWVRFANADGDSVEAYVAYPEKTGKAPALIVIHEIFGMTDWEPTVADRFAAKGYVAIVPDLLSARYHSARDVADSARRLVSELSRASVVRDLDAAYHYIAEQPATNPDDIGIIGFCWGGGQVWNYASHNPDLKAAVVCYGPLADTTLLRTIEAPILGVYGENDGRVTNVLPTITRMMSEMGKPFSADSYPGTGHGFLKPGRKGSGTPAAERAWGNIDAFLAKELQN